MIDIVCDTGAVCIAMGHRLMLCGGRVQQRHAYHATSTSRVQCIDVSPKPLSTKWLPLQSMNQSRYGRYYSHCHIHIQFHWYKWV
jgi:hypothetical protein